jgi:YD repeat-containing protein
MKLHYEYDKVGNVMEIEDYLHGTDSQNPQLQKFEYDELYRLKSAQAITGTYGLYSSLTTYSATTGNMASKASVIYNYNDTDHAHAVTSRSDGKSYQYDANGNMTYRNLVSGGIYYLGYDAENRMIEVTGAYTATYGYDGDGKRILANEGITTTIYIGNYF